jgi:flagellar biosynthetic protein FliR
VQNLVRLIEELARNPVLVGGLQMAGLILARLLPMIALTPLFGGRTVPARFRFGLTAVLTVGFLPGLIPEVMLAPTMGAYTLLTLKEAVIGLTLAMFILVLFESLASAGALVGVSGGTSSSVANDPFIGGQQATIGTFKLMLGLVLFLTLGCHRILFRALGDSFLLIGPGETIPARFFDSSMTVTMIGLVSNLFVVAVKLAAPVILVIFLLDVCLGLINRVAPQIQVFFLGLTIKSTIAVLVLFLVLGLLVDLFRAEFVNSLKALMRTIG